jgi:HEAT repeat protein
MNCEQVDQILDSDAGDALDAVGQQAVEQHLAECAACRQSWAAFRKMAAVSIPATPRYLRQRIAVALAAQGARAKRPARPSVYIGSIAVVGLAVAAAAAVQLGYLQSASTGTTEQTVAPTDAPESLVSAAPATASPPSASAAPTGATAPEETERAAGPAASVANEVSLDPFSIVVLSRPQVELTIPHPEIDAQRRAQLEFCHQAILQQLAAVPGLNVIGGARVAVYADSALSHLDIATQLGAGSVLVVTPDNWCRATQYDPATGAVRSGLMAGSPGQREDGWLSFARRVAAGVRNTTLLDRAGLVAEAHSTVLNSTLSDRERVTVLPVLNRLGPGGRRTVDGIDEAIVAAAVQIGINSDDPSARVGAWVGLRGVADPNVREPLLHALANDPDEQVRMQAAISLHTFRDEPGVREALRRAAADDPSHTATVPCCIPTVREAAHRASLSDEELVDWARRSALDDRLSVRDRLWPLVPTPDNRPVFVDELGDEAALAIFDLVVTGSDEPGVRARALDALSRTRQPTTSEIRTPQFVATLQRVLANGDDEHVRATAARTLQPYVAEPDIRATLEQALEDPSAEVRLAVQAVLEGAAR